MAITSDGQQVFSGEPAHPQRSARAPHQHLTGTPGNLRAKRRNLTMATDSLPVLAKTLKLLRVSA